MDFRQDRVIGMESAGCVAGQICAGQGEMIHIVLEGDS